MKVVVAILPIGVERISEREMQATAIGDRVGSRALADAVEEVQQDLVGDEQANRRESRRGGSTANSAAPSMFRRFASERREGVMPDRGVRDCARVAAPVRDLRGDSRADPQELAGTHHRERHYLTEHQTRIVSKSGNWNLPEM